LAIERGIMTTITSTSDIGFKNHLKLFRTNGDVDVEATKDFMEISLSELANAFGFTVDQIRPDRLSSLAQERIGQLAYVLDIVAELFGGDTEKTKFWVKTPNPNFGGASARELILRGRFRKVHQFVMAAFKERRR
jgi:hypothetical protein